MKIRIFLLTLFCLTGGIAKSVTFTWANTNGGDWNIATNWIPAQVPASGGDVIITNSGTYTVTNSSSATLGNLTLGGTNGIQTLILSSLTLTNAGLVNSNGVLNWNSGAINGSLTVAQGGVLNLTNNTSYQIFGPLTNTGTVNWSSGTIAGYGPPNYGGSIYNAGLWNAQFDGTLSANSGAPAFINAGTFRKSGGAGTTSIGWNFTSTGILDVQTGSLSSSTWVGNSTLKGNYTGSTTINSGVTLTVASNAVFNWNSGAVNGALTVAQGGVLNLTNNTTYQIFGSLTNAGTVNWSAGTVAGYGPPSYNGIIYNAGLWDAQFDGSLSANSGTPAFINVDIFRKSGGTGVTSIAWNFTSTGVFDVQTGSLSTSAWVGSNTLNGNYTGAIGVNTNTTILVSANVTVNWTSGTIANGGFLNISSNAVVNWGSGTINGVLTVAQGGVLNITNTATYQIFGSLTNTGTVHWSAGTISGYGPPTYVGSIYNAGLWDAEFDGSLSANSGTPSFINAGTFRKSGGTGVTSIDWNFTSTGVFDIQTGSLSIPAWVGNNTLNGNYTGSINVGTNTTIVIPAHVTVNWTSGTIASGGFLNISSNAVVNWGNGTINGAVTVAQGGVLNLTNNTTYQIFGSLTNAGTVNWSAGTISGYGPPTYVGSIYNAGLWDAQFDGSLSLASGTPAFINVGTFRKSGGTGATSIGWNFTSTGTFDVQTGSLSSSTWVGASVLNGTYTGTINLTDASATLLVASNAVLNWNSGAINSALTVAQGGVLNITNNTSYQIFGSLTNNGTVNWSAGTISGYGPPSYNGLIDNAGLWNAQFDGSLSLASGSPLFINTGTFRKSGGIGTTSIGWNLTSTGTFDIQTGSLSTSAWVGDNILNGNYTGTISANSNATVTVSANVRINWTGGTIAAGGIFNVASNAVVYWGAGEVDGSLMVAQGGVLNITNNTTYYIHGLLTNNGTVNWLAGTIYGYGPPSYNGLIDNAGLWNAQFDGSLALASGAPAFINTGTFRKSGGTGITSIGWNFTSTGIFDVPTGSLSSSTWVSNNILNGNYAGSVTLNNGVTLTVASNAVLNWNSGTISGSLTVGLGGRLNITNNTTYYIQGPLTNDGTVNWSSGSLYGYGPPSYNGLIYNAGLWNAQSDDSLTLASGTPACINMGIFRKSGGSGITSIGWNFTNSLGMLDAKTNRISLTSSYDLTGGTLNFGINNLTNYGSISLAGAAPLSGTVSASLNNGYLPIGGNSFTNLFYSSFTGIFTNAALPFADAWSTNYHPSFFVLNVLNARPILAPLPTNTLIVNELINLTVTNSATDADIPAQMLTYSLAAGTNGTVNPATGTFTWTPQQTNSPSTNAVSVAVTDNGTPLLSVTNSFTVVVKEVNVAPSLSAISTQIVNELTLLTVTNSATNFNIHSTITGYALVNPPSNMTINASGVITWTPAQAQSPGTNLIATIVTNSNPYDLVNPQLTSTNQFTVIVKEVNVAPSLPAISTQIVNELTLLTVANSATNFNIHSTITGYALDNPPSNMAISASGIITWTPAQAQSPGTNLITTIVTNSNPYDLVNPRLTSTNQFTVIVKEVNVAPSLPTISTQVVNELTLLTVTNSATNSNIHSAISGYTLVNPPSNMVVSASGIITWTPAQAQSPGTNLITTIVTNSNSYDLANPQLTATNTFTIIVKEVNAAPSLPTISTQIVNELTLLTVTNTATNSNIHATITGYRLVSPPSNLVVSASGIITWTPAQAQSPSTNIVTTIVTNSDVFDLTTPQLTATNVFTIIVKEVNVAPSLPTISTQIVNELTLLTVTNTATNFNIHASITGYTLVNPPGNMVVSASGIITWMPGQAQSPSTNTITTIVTNSDAFDLTNPQLTATNAFTIIVKEVNVAPVLPTILTQTITLLKPFAITNSATEPNIHSITGNYLLLVSPAGAAINSSGIITWVPAQNQSLTTNIIMTVVTNSNPYDLVNPHLSSTNSFSVIVLPSTVVTNLGALNSGGTNLTLNWPADHTGWRLEIQTNALTKGLGTNWTTLTGSSATNQEIITIVPTNNAVFFRMAYP